MMKTSEPSIVVRVATDNPGQFLACCGILELSDRLWGGAEGWFSDGFFHTATSGDLATLLDLLVKAEVEETKTLYGQIQVDPGLAPLCLQLPEAGELILDSWVTCKADKGKLVAAANSPWKFWAGQQTPLRVWNPLRAALLEQLMNSNLANPELFGSSIPLTGRFGFDPAAAWNARDAGFSPNEQKFKVASSPALELLALIGLQRFRPLVKEGTRIFEYSTWQRPLSPSVASAAATGRVDGVQRTRYQGSIASRGKYSAMNFATLIKG